MTTIDTAELPSELEHLLDKEKAEIHESEDIMVPWDVDYPPMVPGSTPSASSKRMARRWTFTLSSALGTDPSKLGNRLDDLDESNEDVCDASLTPTPTSPIIKVSRLPLLESQDIEQPGCDHQSSDIKRCPCCNRTFAPRSYDRHVLLCSKTPCQSPLKTSKQEAKDRLEARTKYRPEKHALKKTVKEKYQKATKETKDKPAAPQNSAKSTPLPTRRTVASVTKSNKSVKTPVKSQKIVPNLNSNNKTKIDSKSAGKEEYNPFVIAERQLMELLECTDYSSKKVTHKPEQKPKSSTSKIVTTPKQRDMPSNIDKVVTKEEMDFEALENFINDNFDNDEIMDKLDLDTISLGGCSIKTDNTSYFDDVSIDPRLINDFDNLSIPEHFDTQATTTPDIGSQYHFANCIRLDPLGRSDHLENMDMRNIVYKKPVIVEDKSNNDKLPSPKDDNKTTVKTDSKMYEEFTFFDKNYIIKRDVLTDAVGPGDSAYGSLNRTTKIRSKVAPLAYFESSVLKEEDVNSDGDTATWAKFCHQCGKTYPIKMARFCVWCGSQRLCLE